MSRNYYLGLDMGTSSLGWAVTDPEYHLLRAKGKDLWGVRLFPEAESSAGRRTQRISRRRLQRKKAKISFVKDVFADAINEVDPGFYQRLDDSKYYPEDKTEKQKYALFCGAGFTDKEYYEQYPTIFHLRSDLIHSGDPKDVRLVYLAVLNIFKHRGHFLNANLSEGDSDNLESIYEKLVDQTANFPAQIDFDMVKEILSSKKISNSRRHEQLIKQLNIQKKAPEAEMLKLICGLKGKIVKLFPDAALDEENSKYSFSFRDGNYDEKDSEIQTLLDDDDYELVQILKQIHDRGLLAGIMRGEQYLSDARVKAYEKHAYDLKILKDLYKKYGHGQYNKMFRIMENHNYSSYTGSVNSEKERGKIRRGDVKCDRIEFYKRVKDDIQKMQKKAPADDRFIYVLEEIEKETFLPKQLTSENGVIPYQVHLKELKQILKNAEAYLPFLREIDEAGMSNSEKIVSLFAFQIPYYIGPLYNDQNPAHNAWVCRKETGKVYPWNYEQKIDVKKTSEVFVQRMVRHCTYLQSEDVLPKRSLLYEKFMVLNEMNNLKINGLPIDISLKHDIYKDLFRKEKKVTAKKIRDYLSMRGLAPKKAPVVLSGIDGDFKNSLTSYQRFLEIFSTDVLSYEQEQIAEKIIFWATVYGESKAFLRERIKENYGDILSSAQIKRLCGMHFRDWGRLSKAFLQTEGADRETGEVLTIIDRMWNENVNLMECLSDRFTYMDSIQNLGSSISKTFEEFKYEDLEELYLSAPVRRMVWQTILVVKEIVRVMGCPPTKIFVEMARDVEGKNDRSRKDSRKKKFVDLYKNCKEEGRDWVKEIEDTPDGRFRSKKLYLYYTQKGRCMYTGEPIDLGNLFNDNLYDIDHIYPRRYVKDDSIEKNLVLVKKQVNSNKSDVFPIDSEVRRSRYGWWKQLCEEQFITKEKFERLTRNTMFSAEELAGFISRQIVETRQGTKTITSIFEKSFPDADIIYSKAGVVSDFRHHFKLIKCRELNNFHHANDAYLNIVVGNTYDTKFTKHPMNFIKDFQRDPETYKYHMDKLFDYPVSRGGVSAWKTKDAESIRTVRNVLSKMTPLVTRMNYEESGQLWDQTIYSAEKARSAKGIGYIPINSSDPNMSDVTKYGGYSKYTGTCFFLVEHTVKGKRVRSIEAIPLYLKDKLRTREALEDFCRKTLSYLDPSVRLKRIKMYSCIKVNGFFVYLSGRTNNRLFVINAVEFKTAVHWLQYIKCLYEYSINDEKSKAYYSQDLITKENNVTFYDLLTEKHEHGIYAKRPNPIGKNLTEWRERFTTLSLDRQVHVIKQILQLSSNTNQGADLSDLGGGKKLGVSTLNKIINTNEEFKLISVSPTGLFTAETDLLSI